MTAPRALACTDKVVALRNPRRETVDQFYARAEKLQEGTEQLPLGARFGDKVHDMIDQLLGEDQ